MDSSNKAGNTQIAQNLNRLSETRCHMHNKLQAEYLCAHSDCINNSTSFLCDLCMRNHTSGHASQKYIISTQTLFSKRLLEKAKEIAKDQALQLEQIPGLQEAFSQIGNIFMEFQLKLTISISQYCEIMQQKIINQMDQRKFDFEKSKSPF